MSIPDEATGSHHDPLDAVIAAYLQQVEAGVVPDREALLAQHPDLVDGLREFFADFDRLDRQAGELHLPGAATEAAGERPHVRYFGEYELLEVVARGGMGVVYKARQQSLNRLVALKMILKGQLATLRDVARFRAEAEAAANLDHPHIVPIYEVGEHDGQQYFTMRFIEGPSLARQPRGDLRTEVRLLATVARAVHYAHQHGILHRDIKPSNLLVADGVPFVTDFGLAKRLDRVSDLTEPGETPGTPRYMAPEQTAGRRDLTVAADVYSLGVVLYERMTGATPYRGDDILEVLRQVREAEPPRPSMMRSDLDRDLETVCLKCLEKEPAKRYANAAALADDLELWLRGEPIQARPVGSLGRFTRWCRRNPTVASLTGAVAVALLAGTAISIYFAVEASQRAAAERLEREHAQTAENNERAERQRAQAAEEDLELALARSLLRPMEPDSSSLSKAEVAALWDLATTRNEHLRLRCLEEAMRSESTASQLGNRAEWLVHAAVELDRERRARAEQLLAMGLNDTGKSLRHRGNIAWACLELTDPGSPLERASAEVISQAWAAERNPMVRKTWRGLLQRRILTMAPHIAAHLLGQALMQEPDNNARRSLADNLAAVADRLESAEAARLLSQAFAQDDRFLRLSLVGHLVPLTRLLEPAEAARVLSQALAEQPNRKEFALALAMVAGRIEQAEAAHVCAEAARVLTQALTRWEDRSGDLVEGLVAVAGRLEPTEASRLLFRTLVQHKSNSSDACKRLTAGLTTAADRLEPAAAAAVYADATHLLSQALTEDRFYPRSRSDVAAGLVAVASRLESAEAARVLSQALVKEKDGLVSRELAEGLATVAGRLPPAEAARICTDATRTLIQGLTRGDDSNRRWFAMGLAMVAGRLEPAAATRVCSDAARVLTEALTQTKDHNSRHHLLAGLAAVAGRLESAETARIYAAAARVLSQALANEENSYKRSQLAHSLAMVAGRLEPAEAVRVCTDAAGILTQALSQEKDISHLCSLDTGLAAVAGRLEPTGAARVWAEAVRALIQALAQEKDSGRRKWLRESLYWVTSSLRPAAVTCVDRDMADLLIQALAQGDDLDRAYLAPVLAVIAGLLEPAEAARVGSDMARLLIQALERHKSISISHDLCVGLAAVAGRLEPAELARVSHWWIDSRLGFPNDFARLLADTGRPQVQRRAVAMATTIGIAANGLLASAPFLPSAAEPVPCRLATPDLVEFLKMPTCVGGSRRVILDHLGHRYGRRFDTHWDFVRYAQEQGFDLDWSTPPQPPGFYMPSFKDPPTP